MWTLALGDSGLPGGPRGLEIGDRVSVSQRQSDVVEAFHQTPSAVLVERKTPAQVRSTQLSLDQVDGQFHAWLLCQQDPKLADELLGEHDGQQSTFECVVAEDVAERRRDHRPDSIIL